MEPWRRLTPMRGARSSPGRPAKWPASSRTRASAHDSSARRLPSPVSSMPGRAGPSGDGPDRELSPFHETYGYYAQGVGERTAVLPEGWESRLVPVPTPVCTGLCLEPHDLLISKYVAGRERTATTPARRPGIAWPIDRHCWSDWRARPWTNPSEAGSTPRSRPTFASRASPRLEVSRKPEGLASFGRASASLSLGEREAEGEPGRAGSPSSERRRRVRTRRSASTSAGVVGTPRARSSSERGDELLIPVEHPRLLEVAPDLGAIGLREPQQVLYVGEVLHEARGALPARPARPAPSPGPGRRWHGYGVGVQAQGPDDREGERVLVEERATWS